MSILHPQTDLQTPKVSSSVAQPATLVIEQSLGLHGELELIGAKNAVLCIMASLLLTEGVSVLRNVPHSADVVQMVSLLSELGAEVFFDSDANTLTVDTTFVRGHFVRPEIMKKMRASVLVMGPLLARFNKAEVALPGGCLIGSRPIDFHLKNFAKMGVEIKQDNECVYASAQKLKASRLVLEYPSIGATENLLMAAVAAQGQTKIINAALEPEVLDLIAVLQKMGANIHIQPPATILIEGGHPLKPVEHAIVCDRLEAGTLLCAAAITGGTLHLPNARADILDVFLEKLSEMGHAVEIESGIKLRATQNPKAVSFRTAPYPGFATDLQAPMMALQCLAEGQSSIHETVFENRFLHVQELQKMGAQIKADGDKAIVTGVDELFGAQVIATDIRASAALAVAGFAANGTTVMAGLQHWRRGYESLELKLKKLGGKLDVQE